MQGGGWQQGYGPPQGQQGYAPAGYGPPQGYGPPPPPPKKGMSGGMIALIIVGLLFVLGGGSCAVCIAIGASAGSSKPYSAGAGAPPARPTPVGVGASPAQPTPAEAAISVPIGTLLSAYKGNELAADNSYKGKLVDITGGSVGSIKKDVLDQPYVTVGTGAAFEIPTVQCSLRGDQVTKAATLQKGQRVTVHGRIRGLMFNVQVEDCTIL